METLWAPWRMEYIRAPKKDECVLCLPCAKVQVSEDDAARYVLAKSRHAFVIMNIFPYSNGHCMVVPYRHVSDFCELMPDELADMMALMQDLLRAQKEVLSAEGANVGLNLGQVAGAGIAAHLHMHAVPRWPGDSSFMAVLADVRIISEHLQVTYKSFRDFFVKIGR